MAGCNRGLGGGEARGCRERGDDKESAAGFIERSPQNESVSISGRLPSLVIHVERAHVSCRVHSRLLILVAFERDK